MHCCNLKNSQISLKLLPINLLQQSISREVSGNDCEPKLFEITSYYQLFLHRWLSAAIQFSRIKWKIHNILFHFKHIFPKATQKVYEYGHFKRRVWHLSDLQIKWRRFFFSSDVTSRPPMRGNAICPGDSLHPCGKHSADNLIKEWIKIFFSCLINGVFKAEVCLARQNVAAEAKWCINGANTAKP